MNAESKKSPAPAAGWYQGPDGSVVLWRVFVVLFAVVLVSAVIAEFAGVSAGASVVIMTLLATALAHALVLAPLSHLKAPSAQSLPPRGMEPTTVDALTRIPNRRGITTSLLDAMAYANRYGHPLSVAMVDLDMLSDINAGTGRRAGDKALQAVASVFTDALRMPDRAGRYTGEEFIVILPNTLIKNAARIAERLRAGVENVEVISNGRKVPVTVSIGVAQFRKGEDLERFLSRVDKAVTVAKSSGRNRVATDRPV